ncbi:MAG: hypothetical protein M3N12_09395 [Verrucomicrobiota bacterium]|nr:hypothetical protein [Verrucomicrobiota bacterium]
MDPATNTASDFASGISSPVWLALGPDGCLYYLAQGNNGQVFKISAIQAQAVNISSRSSVGLGDNVMIGGFIITGNAAKKVLILGIGPSSNVPGFLIDPFLELHGPGGMLVTNDNWKIPQQTDIANTGLAPGSDSESGILITLQPGPYTAILKGQGGGTGVGVVEVFDLDAAAASKLANISTRSFVQSFDNRLFGGFILAATTEGES